jgi:hypothetical protein
VSIAAEIIARCWGGWGGGGRPLTETDGRIHHDAGPRTRTGDDAERSDEVGVRPHKWEIPPPACGGKRRHEAPHRRGAAGRRCRTALRKPKVLVDGWLDIAVRALRDGGCDDVVLVLGAADVPAPPGVTRSPPPTGTRA